MALSEDLAQFVTKTTLRDIPPVLRERLKLCILDAIACAIGAMDTHLATVLRIHTTELSPTGDCTLIGGGRTTPDRAALYNSTLTRYLDYNDSFLAKGETCHPSDNLAAILAATEHVGASGKTLLEALALAYQVQCHLSQLAPVRIRGFDHTVQGSYALAAGISKGLNLSREKTANAIGIAGTAFNALRVSRTGRLSNWKGLAYPNLAFAVMHSTLLAQRGITGPLEVFEGTKGMMDSISGKFEIDFLQETFNLVKLVILKKYNAEIHSQSTLEAAIDLREKLETPPELLRKIDITIFDVAYDIIGGGKAGNKTLVETKEEADHSLPYLVAVALLDGEVTPRQFTPERIHRDDVQRLLKRVSIQPAPEFSDRFPMEMPVRLTLYSPTGQILETERKDYEGFHSRPIRWAFVEKKFNALTSDLIDPNLGDAIIETVKNLDSIPVRALTAHLEKAYRPREEPSHESQSAA